MTNADQQSTYPTAPGAYESGATAAHDAADLRNKKRRKCILYIVLFAVFQIAIILIFSLTVMKVRTPKFRINSAALSNVAAGTAANSSFSATVYAELAVWNANFGRYKYGDTAVEFTYRGSPAGQAIVRGSRVSLRSTKRLGMAVDLNLGGSDELASDLRAGILPIRSSAKMSGKVDIFFVMKKKRSTDMICSMEIVLVTQQFRNIMCK